MDAKKMGTTLRALRTGRNQTIAEASMNIGISSSALTMYELGNRVPRDEVKVQIAKYYDKPIEYIFFA